MAYSKLCPKIVTELKLMTVSECRNEVADSFQISSHAVANGVISKKPPPASHDAFCGWKRLLCSPTRQRERHGYLLRGSSCPFPPLNSSERERQESDFHQHGIVSRPTSCEEERTRPDVTCRLRPYSKHELRCTNKHSVHPTTGHTSGRASRKMTYSFLLAANSSVLL